VTSDPPLTQRLTSRLHQSFVELDSVHLSVLRQQATSLNRVEELHRTLDKHQEQRELDAVDQLADRILHLVQSGAFERLSPREARAAARMIGSLAPRDMASLVRAHPAVASNFVEAFFQRWDDLDALPTRSSYAELVVRTTYELPFMQLVNRGRVVTSSGPELVAAAAPRGNGRVLGEWLAAQRLSLRWSFTAHVVANIVARTVHEHGLERFWEDFDGYPALAGLVLPALERPGGRWFSSTGPNTKRGSLRARASVTAIIMDVLHRNGQGFSDELVTALLDSELGDPRLPPESLGWQHVRRLVPNAYDALLKDLIREDLSLFFEHAMHDSARRDFWLLYIKAIRRTVCVLARDTHDYLTRQLAGSTTDLRGALGRVRKFAGSANVSAFCLYFDDIVVVEFSHTGHAAYIYPRAAFDAKIEPKLAEGRIRNETDLKLRNVRMDDIQHRGNWELKAHWLLQLYGVIR
jgi:hypothetical protein